MQKYHKELEDIKKTVLEALNKLNSKKEIFIKDNNDFVTTSDLHIEKHLIKMIQEKYPEDYILSEESYAHDKLRNRTWIIDPIDGTSNYASDLCLYCIQVALYDEDDLVLSYIHLPKLNKTYHALKNQGAFLNGKKLERNITQTLSNALISFIGAYKKDGINETLTSNYLIKAASHNMKIRMLGSVGVELAYMAEGIFQGVYTTARNLWDLAPGVLLIKEAGGYFAPTNDKPYVMGETPLFAWQSKEQYQLFIKEDSNKDGTIS